MTDIWSTELAKEHIGEYAALDKAESHRLRQLLDTRFPPPVFFEQQRRRRCALANVEKGKSLLEGVIQEYPTVIVEDQVVHGPSALAGCAVVLTAGGDGERLRLTLLERGAGGESLRDFTKATFALPGFPAGCGTLQANIALIRHLCRLVQQEIPVIITTGPPGSTTSAVIRRLAAQSRNFGLSHLLVVEQEERLHLTIDGNIAWRRDGNAMVPVTNPDETGGPLMKLKKPVLPDGRSALEWIAAQGCDRILVLQGTALYDPDMIIRMAFASAGYDCLGVGIPRSSFAAGDPYGTFVSLRSSAGSQTVIIEQGVRNDATRDIRSPDGRGFLPFNTGFYALKAGLLRNADLPDYATPPKEVLPGIPRSPKIGYAATDLLGLSPATAVLAVSEERFRVIKNAEDLEAVAALGKRYGVDAMCERSAM